MRKLTKIVATISDRKCEVEFLQKLYDAGMDVVRINTAHQKQEDTLRVIKNVRQVSDKIPVLLDTKGPEIRTTATEGEVLLKKGDKVCIIGDPEKITTRECIYVTYENFVKEVPSGCSILIHDGSIELFVVEKKIDRLVCEVRNNGILTSKKSVNVPGARIKLTSISKKDREYIKFAIDNDIEFIAHSFVRNKDDVLAVQKILDEKKSRIKIIAKIENQEGVDNIDEILEHAYGIMVARGDLGTEIPAEKIPIIQKKIIKKCIEQKKPVITATQMLHSMIKNPRPTRAEVSDIANAIYDGTDAIMLSEETANGDYPAESVRIMAKIAKEVESSKESNTQKQKPNSSQEVPMFLAKAAVIASKELAIKAIVTDTSTGRTARYLSSFSGECPIFAQCYDKRIMRELALSYGVYADHIEEFDSIKKFISKTLKKLLDDKKVKEGDLALALAGNFGKAHGASFIEISTIKNLISK